MAKMWAGRTAGETDRIADDFNASIHFDCRMFREDITGSMAHARMLGKQGIITENEAETLCEGLAGILADLESGALDFDYTAEDIHMFVEAVLTERLGDVGKKLHTARSRNDQVLVDLKLFTRAELQKLVENISKLFEVLISQSNRYKEVLMPGYTHLQVAMPSSFGLWFGAYAESLVDDLQMLLAAFKVTNRNPLGSAAGYGASFPLNRQMTTDLLGFESMNFNVVYAQMGRGKMERTVASAMASVAATLSKLAFDACMYTSQNFGFIKLPAQYTTGSSIMPHKKNPDVFELTRAKCNKIQAIQQQIILITNNLPSGYYRDLQIIKEVFIPTFAELNDCITMVTRMLSEVEINEHILDDSRYDAIFSVEKVNELVLQGVPFRDAYKQVGLEIEAGNFKPNKELNHTHEGSIGNLCNDKIESLYNKVLAEFNFEKINSTIENLVKKD